MFSVISTDSAIYLLQNAILIEHLLHAEYFAKHYVKAQWITVNCGEFWKRWEYQTTWPASWKTYMQVRKQQLELDMEQQIGSK